MWDRDRKTARDNFGNKIKSTGYIYLPGSKLLEDERHLMMMSCLEDAVINSFPITLKYTNTLELYRQFPPRRVKDTKMNDIENTSCVRSVMRATPVARKEREHWVASSIIRRVNDGVYICKYSLRSDEYKC